MKEHAIDSNVLQLGETSCGAWESVWDDRQSVQEGVGAGCTDITSDGASPGGHRTELPVGKNNPVEDFDVQHDIVGDRSMKTDHGTRDGMLDCALDRVKCESSCNDDHIDENCERDSGHIWQLKNAEVSEEANSCDDPGIAWSAETQIGLQISSVRSIAEECEFSCLKKLLLQSEEAKSEVTVSESDSYLAINDGVSESVLPIVIKPEPMSCDEPTQMTHPSNNRKTMISILPKSCDSLIPGSPFNPWMTFADVSWPVTDCRSAVASAVDVRENIDVVGDGAEDSGTDSADDCNRSLESAVPGNTSSHWSDISRAGESTPDASQICTGQDRMTSPELNNTYSVSLNNGELPTLFVEMIQPDADTNSGATRAIASEHDSTLALSESGRGDKKQRIHHDHTYADSGIPGSLTCARTRIRDPTTVGSAEKETRTLRPRAPAIICQEADINKSDVGAAPISRILIRSPKKMAKPFCGAVPSDDMVHVCTICQSRYGSGAFRSRAEFVSHVINRHKADGGRLYYCAYCRYVAMDRDLVKSHMNDKHGHETTRIVSGMRLHELEAKKSEPDVRVTTFEVYLPKKTLTYKEDAKSDEYIIVTVDKRKRNNTSRKVRRKLGAAEQGNEDGAVNRREAVRRSPSNGKTVSALLQRKRKTPTKTERTHFKSESESPSATDVSCVPSPDCWQESPAAQYDLFDNHLDDCGMDLIDGTCSDMFEDRFMSTDWDETEALGSAFSAAEDKFETAKIDDASGEQFCGVSVKQEPLTGSFVETSGCGQGSRRCSRRTRKPSARVLFNSRDAVSPTGKRHMPDAVNRRKKYATGANDGRRTLAVGDKTVVSPRGDDPKLKMRPIVRLCDIIMAIVAGGASDI